MKILQDYNGYLLIERYGRNYVRFMGGREEDMPCEFPVTKDEAQRVCADEKVLDVLIAEAKKKFSWNKETFFEIGIKEYLTHCLHMSQNRTEKSYEKLARYPHIMREFYNFILDAQPIYNPIVVEGHTAKELYETTYLNPLGAYNYLIYLIEHPDEAKAALAAGLPRK